MSHIHSHLHAAFDRFPLLLESLAVEFGTDGLASVAERFIEAEAADFAWEGRFAERNLGRTDGYEDDDEITDVVKIIGYFRSRYYVATCLVDAERRVHQMLRQRHYNSIESAEEAFIASGG